MSTLVDQFSSPVEARGNGGDLATVSTALFPMSFVPRELRLGPEETMLVGAIWGCMRAIVDPLATSPVNVVTRTSTGARQHLENDVVSYLLNVRPNPQMPACAFREILLTQSLIFGNGYAEIMRDAAGRIQELQPLLSSRMLLQRDPETGDVYYQYTQIDGVVAYLRADAVLHVRGPSIGDLLGDSAVMRASKAAALAVAEHQFASAYFASGCVVGGVIKVPAVISPEAKERMQADWKIKGSGRNAHSVKVLEAGTDFVQFETDASRSQLIESRRFSVDEIARFFGVPLVLLQVQASAQGYGRNLSDLFLTFSRMTLAPWAARFTQEAGYKLFPMRAPWRELELDLSGLTRGDELQRAQAAEVWLRTGTKSVNEVRASENMNDIGPEGDLHLVNSSMTLLDEENLTKPEPVAPAPTPDPANPTDPASADATDTEDAADAADPADGQEADPADASVDARLDRFRAKTSARIRDLRSHNHDEAFIAENINRLIDQSVSAFAGIDPVKARAALASVAAGATNAQAVYCLA